jgi:hypothetical protein
MTVPQDTGANLFPVQLYVLVGMFFSFQPAFPHPRSLQWQKRAIAPHSEHADTGRTVLKTVLRE